MAETSFAIGVLRGGKAADEGIGASRLKAFFKFTRKRMTGTNSRRGKDTKSGDAAAKAAAALLQALRLTKRRNKSEIKIERKRETINKLDYAHSRHSRLTA